jgi:hypothetical protein
LQCAPEGGVPQALSRRGIRYFVSVWFEKSPALTLNARVQCFEKYERSNVATQRMGALHCNTQERDVTLKSARLESAAVIAIKHLAISNFRTIT